MGSYYCEATSLEGFVQQVAVSYIARGKYFFYVSGRVPRRLTPHQQDDRMVKKYDVAKSKWARYRRRKRSGPDGKPLANVQYIRHREFWFLLCTEGHHPFFEEHTKRDLLGRVVEREFHDVRTRPIVYGGYSISYGVRGVSVRLSERAYEALRREYLGMAKCRREQLEREFRRFPYDAWGGTLKQAFTILKAVNQERRSLGLTVVPNACIPVKRRSVKPFEQPVTLKLAMVAGQQGGPSYGFDR